MKSNSWYQWRPVIFNALEDRYRNPLKAINRLQTYLMNILKQLPNIRNYTSDTYLCFNFRFAQIPYTNDGRYSETHGPVLCLYVAVHNAEHLSQQYETGFPAQPIDFNPECNYIIETEMRRFQGLCQYCWSIQTTERSYEYETQDMVDGAVFYVFTGINDDGFRDGCIARSIEGQMALQAGRVDAQETVMLPFADNMEVGELVQFCLRNFFGDAMKLRVVQHDQTSSDHPRYRVRRNLA